MKSVYLYTGNRYSNGAKELAAKMGIKRIKVKNSKYYAKPGHTIINWGAGNLPPGAHNAFVKVTNDPPLHCQDKLKTFQILEKANVTIPEWTTDRNAVDGHHTWVARTILHGHGGAGIVIVGPGDPIPDAPLYTKYVEKKYEVRIHVARGNAGHYAFDTQQKRLKRGGVPNKVRNSENGYVFVRNDLSIPEPALNKCILQAIKACKALDMDFGAVDVIYNERSATAYVLEVNSAPGLEGTTLENYANMLKEMVRGV